MSPAQDAHVIIFRIRHHGLANCRCAQLCNTNVAGFPSKFRRDFAKRFNRAVQLAVRMTIAFARGEEKSIQFHW